MDHLQIARNLFDFGIVVVVWLAQVIMYPSLAHIKEDAFVTWHRQYSSRIAFFVIPLLCGQAIIVGIMVYFVGGFLTILSAAIIVLCWVSTFGLSVPCHAKLQRSGKDISVIRRLVRTNLVRTVLWSVVFLIGLWQSFS
ncbi:MAG: hypothetical protein RDU20_08065 [Desulfomonilaceae bacterium]|nr:hypothetical protein [Desulfomonilaceae bacterium]